MDLAGAMAKTSCRARWRAALSRWLKNEVAGLAEVGGGFVVFLLFVESPSNPVVGIGDGVTGKGGELGENAPIAGNHSLVFFVATKNTTASL
jgi:hypothetical protein